MPKLKLQTIDLDHKPIIKNMPQVNLDTMRSQSAALNLKIMDLKSHRSQAEIGRPLEEALDPKGKFLSRQVVQSNVMSQMSSMKDLKSKLISDKHAVGDLSKEEGKVRL